MISLTCNHCQTVLNIDDAFAGGVCRCQHCGTIQTVPSRLKSTSRSASPEQSASAGKTLYRKRTRGDGPVAGGTGLEELAEVVAASGSGSGLVSDRLRQPGTKSSSTSSKLSAIAASPEPAAKQLLPIYAALALSLIALVCLIVWLFVGAGKPKAPASDVTRITSTPDADTTLSATLAAPTGPSFCGVSLDAPVVIYVLDRGNATRDLFDTLKEATFKSIESLGGDRKFQVILWNNGTDDAYPAGLPAFARPENVTACRRALEDVAAFGQSDPIPAITKALNNKANIIVLATGKSIDLDATLISHIAELRRTSNTKINAFALGESDSPVLKEIATKSGGTYRLITGNALRTSAQ